MAWYASKSGNGGAGGVIYLGTGTSFDLSSIKGYEELTVDNFLVIPKAGLYASTGNHASNTGDYNIFSASANFGIPTKSYNASSGILTITQASLGLSLSKSHNTVESKTVKGTHDVYLVMGEIQTL